MNEYIHRGVASSREICIWNIFVSAKSINIYLKAKDSPHATQILILKYLFIDFAAQNLMLK